MDCLSSAWKYLSEKHLERGGIHVVFTVSRPQVRLLIGRLHQWSRELEVRPQVPLQKMIKQRPERLTKTSKEKGNVHHPPFSQNNSGSQK